MPSVEVGRDLSPLEPGAAGTDEMDIEVLLIDGDRDCLGAAEKVRRSPTRLGSLIRIRIRDARHCCQRHGGGRCAERLSPFADGGAHGAARGRRPRSGGEQQRQRLGQPVSVSPIAQPSPRAVFGADGVEQADEKEQGSPRRQCDAGASPMVTAQPW